MYSNTLNGVVSDVNDPALGVFHHSCAPFLTDGVDGNIISYPEFMNIDEGNYRLRSISRCVDSGMYFDWMEDGTDLDGNPRIFRGKVDMGCYEGRFMGSLIKIQ